LASGRAPQRRTPSRRGGTATPRRCRRACTVVEELGANVFEIEVSDNQGRTYAMLALPESKLMVLYHQPVSVAS
jgi:hypothetical protein